MTLDELKKSLKVDENGNTDKKSQEELAKEVAEAFSKIEWGDGLWLFLILALFLGFPNFDPNAPKGETPQMTKDELLKKIGAENKERMSLNEIMAKVHEDWLKERFASSTLTDEDKETLKTAQEIIDKKDYQMVFLMLKAQEEIKEQACECKCKRKADMVLD